MIKDLALRTKETWERLPFALRLTIFLVYIASVCVMLLLEGSVIIVCYLHKSFMLWPAVVSAVLLCIAFLVFHAAWAYLMHQQKQLIYQLTLFIADMDLIKTEDVERQ